MTRNQIEYWNMKETGRHNLATETETNRSNLAREGIDISNLQETQRHNKAVEGETQRSNVSNENIKRQNLDLGYYQAGEVSRHNMATEALTGVDLNIKSGQLAETGRHNIATETVQQTQAEASAELAKANKALTDVQTEWAALKAQAELELTQSQISEIDARIDKYAAEIAKAKSDITRNDFQNANQTANTIIDGLKSISQEVRQWTNASLKAKG